MFPFSLVFEQHLKLEEPLDNTRVFAALTEYIKKNKGTQINRSANKLSFSVSLTGWTWDKFAQIEKGEFVLSDQTICFRAFMYRGFIIGLLMCVFLAAISGKWPLGLFCFACLSAVNLIAASIKYNRMLKTIAENINQLSDERALADKVFMK